jgi:hypothetical protein
MRLSEARIFRSTSTPRAISPPAAKSPAHCTTIARESTQDF